MAHKTLRVTREQIEIAKIMLEADQATGRTTDPLVARIATVDTSPVVIDASEILPQVLMPPAAEPRGLAVDPR